MGARAKPPAASQRITRDRRQRFQNCVQLNWLCGVNGVEKRGVLVSSKVDPEASLLDCGAIASASRHSSAGLVVRCKELERSVQPTHCCPAAGLSSVRYYRVFIGAAAEFLYLIGAYCLFIVIIVG